MDVWGTIVLGVEILLLLAGWLLFQQAKSDLTARAAQLPVLSEVKALQKSVAALLEQLRMESIQTSAQLDVRCAEARDLLAAIDRKLEEAGETPIGPTRKREPAFSARRHDIAAMPDAAVTSDTPQTDPLSAMAGQTASLETDSRKEQVYRLFDDGVTASEIARRTGWSEGEVDLILGLRAKLP